MTKKRFEPLDPMVLLYANSERFKMHQKGLFRWSLIGLVLFLISWNADSLADTLGISANLQKDDPDVELFYLLPVISILIISIIIAVCTGGLTILYWNKLTNNFKKITTLCLDFVVLSLALYSWLRIII